MGDNHKFWHAEPLGKEGNLIKDTKETELPEKFSWHTFEINDNSIDIIYKFLLNYYAENKDKTLRLEYSKELLLYLLNNNKYNDLIIGLNYNNKLVGIICGITLDINYKRKKINCVEITFGCLHKILRMKHIYPLMITEIKRRCVLHDIYLAFFGCPFELPNKLCSGTYYHRDLNIDRLLDADFTYVPENMSLSQYKYKNKVYDINLKLRKMEEKDVLSCHELYHKFYQKYDIYREYSIEEFRITFLLNDKCIETFVVEENNNITDFISFSYLNSQVLNNPKISSIKKAYIYHYINYKTDLEDLFQQSLFLLKQKDIDVVNMVDQMANKSLIEKLNFYEGTGKTYYYLFNYETNEINIENLGLVII
jgi:glycylpeptide N-tetradecanoyltransferase